jgi:hypothetical protein
LGEENIFEKRVTECWGLARQPLKRLAAAVNLQKDHRRSVPPLSQTNPEIFALLKAARRQMGSKRT